MPRHPMKIRWRIVSFSIPVPETAEHSHAMWNMFSMGNDDCAHSFTLISPVALMHCSLLNISSHVVTKKKLTILLKICDKLHFKSKDCQCITIIQLKTDCLQFPCRVENDYFYSSRRFQWVTLIN